MGPPSSESQMDAAHNAARAIAAGTDLNCGNGWDGKAHGYTALPAAIEQGLASEAQLDEVVGRSLKLRMRTGLFDPVEAQPYTRIPLEKLGAQEHHDLAEGVAAQGLVLLKNPRFLPEADDASRQDAAILPLDRGKKTAVIGPHAHAERQLLGSYFSVACPLPARCPRVDRSCPHGSADVKCADGSGYCALDWSCSTSPFAAISALSGGATTSAAGCSDVSCSNRSLFPEAMETAQDADQLVVVVGIDADIECEGRDRSDTRLPGFQQELALQLLALRKPTVVVLLNGGIVSVDQLAAPAVNCAIVEAWNPGIRGGWAIAKALFGITNRWGKLPVTVYDSSFSESVRMVETSITSGLGRTYKYWTGPAPLFEFGHGLSLTTFALAWKGGHQPAPVVVSSVASAVLKLEVVVSNSGARAGDEVVMIYLASRGGCAAHLRRRPGCRTVAWSTLSASRSSRVPERRSRSN